MFESIFTVLNCGQNCSGYSSSLTLDKVTSRGERKVVAICLINAGDSVQKFCNENHIKLKMVICVLITSLAPHNVSGLPGLILAMSSLGAETLSIIAPPGVKGLLDVMIPFTNRKLVQFKYLICIIFYIIIFFTCIDSMAIPIPICTHIYIYIYTCHLLCRYPRLDVHEITKTDGKVYIESIPYFNFEITAVCHSVCHKTSSCHLHIILI